ncbi:MAG: recombinase family protein [Rhodospirillaceae bacterium]|jgi:DNA invertase Pin-like site-specific DNA recombinase|nr:recombinase family protein [Rhodospirillaceae bacterium]MBT4118290.1 recombinase family protein [Rhodospirillaceae bacterium]MBT4747860.1 recombinase family protein [Rhodospirillaceae bacterium]MBT6861145.1 recombinase family protein [Rhodospirillaceae bacterium]MBT7030328.1 recombinase family protein [Rhodospirillaceae bacterium]
MLIGYARTSTLEQVAGFDAQIAELNKLGCDKIYREQVSSVVQRDELNGAIDFAREGDTLVVTKLDRLARSISHLWSIIELLEEKHVGLRILDIGIDTKSATGKLILTILGGINQFEREMMLERQREGIARAKAEGKYKGRKPTARNQSQTVIELRKSGVPVKDITKQLPISRASVYRILNAAN